MCCWSDNSGVSLQLNSEVLPKVISTNVVNQLIDPAAFNEGDPAASVFLVALYSAALKVLFRPVVRHCIVKPHH